MLVVFVLGLLLAFFVHRARRKRTLAGLNSDRPVFSVDPPQRRLSPRKREAL